MLAAVRTRKARWALVPALLTASFALIASGGGAAQAGGVPSATCPSGTRVNITIPEAGAPVHPAVHVDTGFYALSGFFWPPSTLIACRTSFKAGHPVVRPGGTGCHQGALPLQIPSELPTDLSTAVAVDWGTFLPGGWYFGGSRGPDWATVCWYARQPANDGTPAGAPTTGTPAIAAASVPS
ncbi:hypothetical protein [Pseudofrankia sp. BMG5.36]|uniref:hypothetical protein n=1 Tax=Pseudofrankia sp. BMG5.36 TaxID=1834512 RepID=UPI001041CD08|nr:hypothetical protein [Pseudofrankia sp. BMG5.36]